MTDELTGTATEDTCAVETAEPGSETSCSIGPKPCNDCIISRLLKCMKETCDHYGVPDYPISNYLLKLNILGLRRPDSVSDRFDDRLVVFYKPIKLKNHKVNRDALAGGVKDRLALDAIDDFLGDAEVRRRLKMSGGAAELLPGFENCNDKPKACQKHLGWRVLVYQITTEPGQSSKAGAAAVKHERYLKDLDDWKKKPEDTRGPAPKEVPAPPDSVQISEDSTGQVLMPGRGVLQPKAYVDSHRFFLHHGTKIGGYVAFKQATPVDLRRAFPVSYILDKLRKRAEGTEGGWKHWLDVWRGRVAKQEKAESDWGEYEDYLERKKKHSEYLKALRKWRNGKLDSKPPEVEKPGKKVRKPRTAKPAGPAPGSPTEDGWLETYLNGILDGVLSIEEKTGRELLEIREKTLTDGKQRPLDTLQIVHALTPTGTGSDKSWSLDIQGLRACHGVKSEPNLMADDDIVVVADPDLVGINIHRSRRAEGWLPAETRTEKTPPVGEYSHGCQVFRSFDDFRQFRALCVLSKRAWCKRRHAKTPPGPDRCPSVDDPEITVDNLIVHYYAGKRYTTNSKGRLVKVPRGEDIKRWKEIREEKADEFLRDVLSTESVRTAEFADALVDRVNAINLTGSAISTSNRFSPTWTKKAGKAGYKSTWRTRRSKQRTKENREVFNDHLIPDVPKNDRERRAWWKRCERMLLDKLEVAVKNDLNSDAELTKCFDDAAKAEKARKPRSSAKRIERVAMGDKKVKARWEKVEDGSVQKKLDTLAKHFDTITKEAQDRAAFAFDEIKKRLTKKAEELNADGLEVCDLFGECKERFTYMLAAPSMESYQAVLDVFKALGVEF